MHPIYFYQRKRVSDYPKKQEKQNRQEKIESDNILEDVINFTNSKCINNNLSGVKHYTKPLIKNIESDKIHGKVDINMSNKIRSGFTRLDTPIFKKDREQIEDNRFQFLTKNYQDPDKLIMPFPRGGEMTREKYNKNFND